MLVPTFLAQQSIADLPPAAHLLMAAALGAGLVTWLFGQRLLRPMFGALGAVFGSLVGFFLAPAVLPSTVFNVPSPYLGAAITASLGLIAGILLFRFAVAIGMAIVAGLAALLITGALLNSPPVRDAAAAAGNSLPPHQALIEASNLKPLNHEDLRAAAGPVSTRVREFLRQRSDQLSAAWAEIPQRDQVRLALAAIGGWLLGLLLGMLMPRRSAAACTAFLGAAIWLPSLGWILHALEAPGRGLLDQTSVVWLSVWLGVALLGFTLQVASIRKAKKQDD